MREILFRGKSIHGEWICGYLNQHRGNIRYDCDCEPIADGGYYINDWQAKIDTGMYGQDYKVDPDTVGQFTGLTDRNGVKIFEGDIVNYNGETGYIGFDEENAEFLIFFSKWTAGFDSIYCDRNAEVIGNIHDTQELLEVNNDE